MLTINANGAIAYLGGLLARMANMQPVMAKIGNEQRVEIQDRLLTGKQGPGGEHWDAWAPYTRAQRERKGNTAQGLLWDTGALIGSIRSQAEPSSVTIGTDLPYADELQIGRSSGFQRMPGRPFVGWSTAGLAHAENAVVRYLEGINE